MGRWELQRVRNRRVCRQASGTGVKTVPHGFPYPGSSRIEGPAAFPIPTLVRQMANAGYAHFRFDAPAPPGTYEPESQRCIYDRPLDAAPADDEPNRHGAGGPKGERGRREAG